MGEQNKGFGKIEMSYEAANLSGTERNIPAELEETITFIEAQEGLAAVAQELRSLDLEDLRSLAAIGALDKIAQTKQQNAAKIIELLPQMKAARNQMKQVREERPAGMDEKIKDLRKESDGIAKQIKEATK